MKSLGGVLIIQVALQSAAELCVCSYLEIPNRISYVFFRMNIHHRLSYLVLFHLLTWTFIKNKMLKISYHAGKRVLTEIKCYNLLTVLIPCSFFKTLRTSFPWSLQCTIVSFTNICVTYPTFISCLERMSSFIVVWD